MIPGPMPVLVSTPPLRRVTGYLVYVCILMAPISRMLPPIQLLSLAMNPIQIVGVLVVPAWQLSNTLDGAFCLGALDQALEHGKPGIFNTDQGAQFTARAFTGALEAAGIRIGIDGRGRAFDNQALDYAVPAAVHLAVKEPGSRPC